jgi:hypothetical protein
LGQRLGFERLSQGDVPRIVQFPLGHGEGQRRACGDCFDDVSGGVIEFVGWDDLVDQSQSEGVRRANDLAGEGDRLCLVDSDPLTEQP